MKRFLLPFVLLIAFLLRFVLFAQYPVGFNADEASFGYDAYSIFHTGRDQWGNFMPLVLKSFGDYKSPLYSYITIPFVGILGLTKFAVRLPNALVGTLAVLAVYLLTLEIFRRYKKELAINKPELPALAAAFLLSVNPWHVMMSRGAFEANLVTFFIPMGIYFFLKGLENYKFFIWSALFFGISLFSYHSAKLITPLVGFGLLVLFWKKLKSLGLKRILLALFVFTIFLTGILYTFKIGGGSRISERSITQGALEEGAQEKIALIQAGANPIVTKILHNKYQVVLQRFTSNYSQYFSLKFLFINGAGETSYGMVPGIAVIYIFDGLLLLGIIPLLLQRKTNKIILAIVFWLLISPLPGALTTGVGFAGNRAEGMLPAVQILEVFGLIGWLNTLKKFDKKIVFVAGVFLSIIVFWEIKGFGNKYFTTQPETVEKGMLVGDLETAQWLTEHDSEKNVIVSRTLSEPQIFIAFAGKVDPIRFQKETSNWGFDESGLSWVDQLTKYSLNNYTFKSLNWETDGVAGDTLIVGTRPELKKGLTLLKTFNYSDGNLAVFVTNGFVSTRP